MKGSVKLFEFNLKELGKTAQDITMKRSLKLKSKYVGIDKNGVARYRTTSGTFKGKFWNQTVRFVDFKQVLDLFKGDRKVTLQDMADLMVAGDIMVHCNDPSWKYWGWQYIGSQLGYAIKNEKRFPKIRNPKLKGSVCKHLLSVFRQLPEDLPKIASDLYRLGVTRRTRVFS